MTGVTKKTVVNRSPIAVWAYLADVSNSANYMPSVTSAARIESGLPHAGMTFRETKTVGGKLTQHDVVVTKFDPPHVFQRTEKGTGMEFTHTFRLAPNKQHCEVELTVEAKANGFVGKLLGGASRFYKENEDTLERFKYAIETARMDRINEATA